jgi:hypothetical protein
VEQLNDFSRRKSWNESFDSVLKVFLVERSVWSACFALKVVSNQHVLKIGSLHKHIETSHTLHGNLIVAIWSYFFVALSSFQARLCLIDGHSRHHGVGDSRLDSFLSTLWTIVPGSGDSEHVSMPDKSRDECVDVDLCRSVPISCSF